jgi:protein TonB
MARTLVALTIALGVHGLLLVADLPPMRKKPLRPPVPRVVTMTLGYRQPEKPAVEKPETEAQQPMPSESTPVAPRQIQTTPEEPGKKTLPRKRRMRRTAPEPKPKTPIQAEPLDARSGPMRTSEETEAAVDRESETEAGQVLSEAKPLYRVNPPPSYPRMARRQGYEGMVVLEVLVDRRGRVGDLRVLSSSGFTLLDKAAMAAVEKWLFEPGRRGDEAVAMRVRVPIRFVLE